MMRFTKDPAPATLHGAIHSRNFLPHLPVCVMRSFAIFLLCAASFVPAPSRGAPADTPLESLPYAPGLDLHAMDPSAGACVDFYEYACGGWMKENPIPPDQASWDVYRKLAQDNQRFLWGILDDLAKRTDGRDATQAKIGDYFAACMDEAAVEARGIEPLRPSLARIERIASPRDLA